ncbi:MAG: type II toxin-antitoxin system RelE/ParE family toxin [Verrucomicrobiales bacterium]|jgi:plasmid stabilization system protein ParE|nr:type II toxin-antitoxin system RelE/ParE family toxin [Verrucomicrobiales bacterium]HQZ29749.1 type II toxin-antitoxin system RelE/ParE family toxin [Verrucomicrobiales bacterium]
MEEYEIVFAPTAQEDLQEILEWLEEEAPGKVSEWYVAIKETIQTLSEMPERCPRAPENGLWGDEELRQLLFQNYPSKYRIIYCVSGNFVRILNIRHGARRFLHEE